MKKRTIGGRQTPSPPTNPPEPRYTHSDHCLNEEPLFDFDGPGVDESEMVDSPITVVVRERYTCRREGCDASGGYNHLYTLDGLSDGVRKAVRHAARQQSWYDHVEDGKHHPVTEEDEVEYVAMNATIVEYDHKPILGIEFGEDVFGYVRPDESVEKGHIDGECFGQPERPSHEPRGL